MTTKELEAQFKAEVHDRAKLIDPDGERDWYDLTYGWALGKGLPPSKAQKFAVYIRYRTVLG